MNEYVKNLRFNTLPRRSWIKDEFAFAPHRRGGSRGRVQGVRTPPPWDDLRFSNTTGILQKKETMWFIGVEVEQETSALPPKINPGSAPAPSDRRALLSERLEQGVVKSMRELTELVALKD